MKLSNDLMWKATIDCDQKYDGKFFYAVKTVGVYCRPSCKSRTPLRKNVSFYLSPKEAENDGFRPCKRCRPDLIEYAPMQELAKKTKELIDGYFLERKQLSEEMKNLGVSTNHLSAVFKKEYGVPPIDYLALKRVEYARELLTETDTPIIDIANEIGFESLSAFYSFFKKHSGCTPKNYRTGV